MNYEYKNQHFSVEIAEALLADVSTSGSKIASIRNCLLDKHLKSGGLGLPNSMDEESVETETINIVRKALQNESKKAKTSCINSDIWRIAKRNQWIFGKGKHWVYLYYFANETRIARVRGKSWKCKIGKADGFNTSGNIVFSAPEKRVKNQTSGYHEKPVIALLLRTDLHDALEDAIHAILALQGKHLPKAQGKEWFLTTPSDVVKIVAGIDFGLLSPVYDLSPVIERMEK